MNLIVEPVGGTERFKESLRALAPEGRIVVVGFASGEIPEIRVNRLLLRNIDVRGCSFGALASDPSGITDAIARLDEPRRGRIGAAVVGSVHALDDGVAALRELDERRAPRQGRATSATLRPGRAGRCASCKSRLGGILVLLRKTLSGSYSP